MRSENLSIANKKGQNQISGLAPIIITMVIAGVFLILGLVMMQSLRDTSIISNNIKGTTVNESFASVTEIGVRAGNAGQPGFNSFTVLQVINNTGQAVIPASNYTYTSNGTIRFNLAQENLGGFNNSNWNVTYTWESGDQAYSSTNTTLVGLASFADFWEIMILAVVISIVIGLLLVVFGGRSSR